MTRYHVEPDGHDTPRLWVTPKHATLPYPVDLTDLTVPQLHTVARALNAHHAADTAYEGRLAATLDLIAERKQS
jgi:hypothetical protein